MIVIGLGANLPHPVHGHPVQTLEAVLAALPELGIRVQARAAWYETAPVPESDQPWFVNTVALLATDLPASDLLTRLHDLEHRFARIRLGLNSARTVDLDLLDYHGQVSGPAESGDWPVLPHPRLSARAFVLVPLAEIAPEWRHPVTGAGIAALVAKLDPGQKIRRFRARARESDGSFADQA